MWKVTYLNGTSTLCYSCAEYWFQIFVIFGYGVVALWFVLLTFPIITSSLHFWGHQVSILLWYATVLAYLVCILPGHTLFLYTLLLPARVATCSLLLLCVWLHSLYMCYWDYQHCLLLLCSTFTALHVCYHWLSSYGVWIKWSVNPAWLMVGKNVIISLCISTALH